MNPIRVTATVANGQLLLTLPDDWNGKTVVAEISEPPVRKPLSVEEKLELFRSMCGKYNGPPIPDELLRRENLYSDDGR